MDILIAIYLSGVPVSTLPAVSAYDCEKDIPRVTAEVMDLLAPFPLGFVTPDGAIRRATDYAVGCATATDHLMSLLLVDPPA